MNNFTETSAKFVYNFIAYLTILITPMTKIFLHSMLVFFLLTGSSHAQSIKERLRSSRTQLSDIDTSNISIESDQKTNIRLTYYENGNINYLERKNSNGELNGICRYYRPDGSLEIETIFTNGRMIDENGQFFNGKLVTKHSNGKFSAIHNLQDGLRVGVSKYFFENGNIKEKRFYGNDGEVIKVEYYDLDGELIYREE